MRHARAGEEKAGTRPSAEVLHFMKQRGNMKVCPSRNPSPSAARRAAPTSRAWSAAAGARHLRELGYAIVKEMTFANGRRGDIVRSRPPANSGSSR